MAKITLFFLLLPFVGFAQTIKFNLGPSFSKQHGESRTGVSTAIGIDFLETKWTFISANLGLVQRGISKHSYPTANVMVNVKLSQRSFIPFISAGPRLDYFSDAPETFSDSRYVIGANGGAGLIKRLKKMELGVRADYHYNFTKKPDDRSLVTMAFIGFKL